MKIVILDGYTLNPGDLSWEGLKKLGNCKIYDRTLPHEVVSRSKDANIIFTNKVILNKKIISQLPKLRYIGVLATGYNVVDLQAATRYGIVVTNIPSYSTSSVAQMVFSHILNIVQNISFHASSVQNGKWSSNSDFSYRLTPQIELSNKTLGIIGFGQIGQAVAKIGLSFGMNILYNNRSKKETNIKANPVNLETLLSNSDIISLNCPLTKDNKEFINKTTLSQMKTTAILINTGRGSLINETDLANALNSNNLAGAGLDVLSTEPPHHNNPLLTAKNCFITPHIAWATKEARHRLMDIAINNLKTFIGGQPINVVNTIYNTTNLRKI